MAQGVSWDIRGDLVRRPVLSATPVRLPRRGHRETLAGTLHRDGAPPVFHHDTRSTAGDAVRPCYAHRSPRLPAAWMAARQAAAGGRPGRLPRLVLPADAQLAGWPAAPDAALVPALQRGTGAVPGGDRGAGRRQTLRRPWARGYAARDNKLSVVTGSDCLTRCGPVPRGRYTSCRRASRRR